MPTLSDEGRKLLEAAREAYGPSESDRVRNRKLFSARIAAAAVVSAAAAGTAVADAAPVTAGSSSAASVWSQAATVTGRVLHALLGTKAGAGIVAASLAAGGAISVGYQRTHPESAVSSVGPPQDPTHHPPTAVALDLEPPAPNSASGPASGPEVSGPVSRASPPRLTATPPGGQAPRESRPAMGALADAPTPDIEGEVALLGEAQKALAAGRPDRALLLFDQHAREFPRGGLSEERAAGRIIALCKLGQLERARREAEAFLRKSGGSPLAQRVRAGCAKSVTAAPR